MNKVNVFQIFDSKNGFSRVSVGGDLFKALTNNTNPMPHKVSKDANGKEIKVYTLENGMKIWTRTENLLNEDKTPKLNDKNYQLTQTFIIMREEDALACKVSEPDEIEKYDFGFEYIV